MSENLANRIEGQEHIANAMRLKHESDSTAILLNNEFAIQRDVFHPGVCRDLVEHTCKEVLRFVEEGSTKETFDFLEVGCGAGYISVLVALYSEKCRVWATDINEAAVANTKENAKSLGVEHRVKAVVADVFSNSEVIGRKFDMIYWAPPFAGQFTEKDIHLDPLMCSLIDPGYSGLRRFLSDAESYLKENGRLFLLYSNKVGPEELFKSIVHENGWRLEIRSSQNFNLDLIGTSIELPIAMVELVKKEA